MAHFRGVVRGGRGEATRNGHKTTGLTTTAASWSGALEVELWHDARSGSDRFRVVQRPWHGAGVHEVIAEGVVGQPLRQAQEVVH